MRGRFKSCLLRLYSFNKEYLEHEFTQRKASLSVGCVYPHPLKGALSNMEVSLLINLEYMSDVFPGFLNPDLPKGDFVRRLNKPPLGGGG